MAYTVIDRSTGAKLGQLVRTDDNHYTYSFTRRGRQQFALARLDRSSLAVSA